MCLGVLRKFRPSLWFPSEGKKSPNGAEGVGVGGGEALWEVTENPSCRTGVSMGGIHLNDKNPGEDYSGISNPGWRASTINETEGFRFPDQLLATHGSSALLKC